jgi:hypothetical protein
VDADTRTIGDLLRLELTEEPPVYRLGTEPAPPPRARPPRRRASPLDRTKVAPFYAAALAGVPDADVARAAGVSVAQVRGWRLRLGIKRGRGSCSVAKIHGAMLSTPALAELLRDIAHREEPEPPAPVRIDYDELAPLLEAHRLELRQKGGTSFQERASDLGRKVA